MKGIIIHCSDSPQGRGDDAKTIHGWHLARGWDGNGYHHIILEDGTVQGARPHFWGGAHAKGYNDYIGICLIGKKNFTPLQFAALALHIKKYIDMYNIPLARVKGHNEVSSKSCPNFDVRSWIKTLNI